MSLLDSARDHLRQLLGVVQTRLELVGLELADARDHLVALLIYAAASVFFAVITVIAGLAWLLIAYWEQRLMIIGGATVLFALLTVVAIWRAGRHAQSGGDIFADSLCFGDEARGFMAFAEIGIAEFEIALRQAVETHDQAVALIGQSGRRGRRPMSTDFVGDGVDVTGIIGEIAYIAQFRLVA